MEFKRNKQKYKRHDCNYIHIWRRLERARMTRISVIHIIFHFPILLDVN